MRFLNKLFGNKLLKPTQDQHGLYYTVQCNRCKSLIHIRIDSRNDLSLNDEETAYFVRKTLVDDTCFRRIEMEIVFDLQRRQVSCDLHGGTLIES